MPKFLRTLLLLVASCVLLVGACADDDDGGDAGGEVETGAEDASGEAGSTEEATTTSVAAGTTDDTVQVRETSLGEVLVGSNGMTLYLFTRDSDGKSACTGGCAETWPPLTADAAPTAGAGLDASKLGTITRDDGSTQVTYAGKPLYFYAKDTQPGDVTGQTVGGVWFVVDPDGEAITEQAAPSEPSY